MIALAGWNVPTWLIPHKGGALTFNTTCIVWWFGKWNIKSLNGDSPIKATGFKFGEGDWLNLNTKTKLHYAR